MFYQGLIAELRIKFHLNPDGRSHTEESLQRGMAFPLRLQVICQSRSLLQYCIAHLMIFCSMFKIEGLQCQLLHYHDSIHMHCNKRKRCMSAVPSTTIVSIACKVTSKHEERCNGTSSVVYPSSICAMRHLGFRVYWGCNRSDEMGGLILSCPDLAPLVH